MSYLPTRNIPTTKLVFRSPGENRPAPREEKADTDHKVTIADANGTHTGNALEADNKARTLRLRNGVVGELNAHPN